MQSVWKLPSRASAPSPSPSSSGDSPPPHPIPPDPPDPLSPLSPQEYPLLSSTPLSKQKRNTVPEPLKKGLLVLSSISSTKIQPVDPTVKAQFESVATIASDETGPQIGSEIPTAPVHSEETHVPILNFITINPKSSSPIITNKASSSQPTNPPASTTDPSLETNPPPVTLPPTLPMPTQTTPSEPSLVERLRISEDKTLKRLAPVTISET